MTEPMSMMQQVAWMDRMQKLAREVGWGEAVRRDREERERADRESSHPNEVDADGPR